MTKRAKTYEGPLFLDMPFQDALSRFAKTNPNDLGFTMAMAPPKPERRKMPELIWTKNLSTTDAQQPTTGGIVPYLRLTKSSLKTEDFQSWFRDGFFANANWNPGTFGRETDIESCHIDMAVSINGVKLGKMQFTVTHGPNRKDKNNTPNTWLHWPPALQDVLHENDATGWPITMTRHEDGSFSLDIQAAKGAA